jgi:hypothetical protein
MPGLEAGVGLAEDFLEIDGAVHGDMESHEASLRIRNVAQPA